MLRMQHWKICEISSSFAEAIYFKSNTAHSSNVANYPIFCCPNCSRVVWNDIFLARWKRAKKNYKLSSIEAAIDLTQIEFHARQRDIAVTLCDTVILGFDPLYLASGFADAEYEQKKKTRKHEFRTWWQLFIYTNSDHTQLKCDFQICRTVENHVNGLTSSYWIHIINWPLLFTYFHSKLIKRLYLYIF